MPKKWAGSLPSIQNGTSSRLLRFWAKGSCGTRSGAKSAQITAMPTMTAPIQVLTLFQPRLGPALTVTTLMDPRNLGSSTAFIRSASMVSAT